MKFAERHHAMHYIKKGATHTMCGWLPDDVRATCHKDRVTCKNCRRILGLGLSWAQKHALTVHVQPVSKMSAKAKRERRAPRITITMPVVGRLKVEGLRRVAAMPPNTVERLQATSAGEFSAKAIDSLMRRAFVDTEARMNELCDLARKSLTTWDDADRDDLASAGENMADVLRGFLSALGRADS